MNEYFLKLLETMYSAIEHYVNMALYKCCILLLLLLLLFIALVSAKLDPPVDIHTQSDTVTVSDSECV